MVHTLWAHIFWVFTKNLYTLPFSCSSQKAFHVCSLLATCLLHIIHKMGYLVLTFLFFHLHHRRAYACWCWCVCVLFFFDFVSYIYKRERERTLNNSPSMLQQKTCFVVTNIWNKTFLWQKWYLHNLVMTKDVFCHDKHVFVATKVLLWQNYVCRDNVWSRQNYVCHDKRWEAHVCHDKTLLQQNFVATKMILVAVAASDRGRTG